jgi:cysteine desulfurase
VHVTIYNHFTFLQLAARSKRQKHWVATSSTGQGTKSKHNRMAQRSYFDWNATAPLREEARAAFAAALAVPGNPSSVHAEGRAARSLIEQAREQVAALVGARPGDVFFTSSGTEANMLALTPAIDVGGDKRLRSRLFLSAVEHVSVRSGGRFPRDAIEEIAVDADGRLDLLALEQAVAKWPRALVSLMLANNETGVIQPVAAAASILHAAHGVLHVDAVQAAGRVDCDIAALGADLLTLSAHKIGGPKGVGALIRRSDDIHLPDPLIRGGGQERGLRAGTENVAGIAAFGAAAAVARRERQPEAAHMLALRTLLETGLRARTPAVTIFGSEAERLPNTTLFGMPGMKAETAVIAFDLEGIAVSSGAACSSGKVQPSHVLAAMGVLPPLARGAVRVSLGWSTTAADIEMFLGAWIKLASALSNGSKERRGIAA